MARMLCCIALVLLFMVSDARGREGDLVTIRMDAQGNVHVDNAMNVRDAREAESIKALLFKAVHEAVKVRP